MVIQQKLAVAAALSVAIALALLAPRAFWLLVIVGICGLLLGIARILPGTYTPAEVGLTIVIAAASLAGRATVYGRGGNLPANWLNIQLSILRH